jgi:hypothetical protein
VVREQLAAEGIDLAEPHGAKAAGGPEPEVDPADPGEERQHREH